MKRFVLGILVGVALTLVFQSKGPEILRAVGVNPDSVSKAEKGFKKFLEDSEDATEEVTEGLGEKVKDAGKKMKKIMDN